MISGTNLFFGLFNNLAIFIILVAVYGFLNSSLEKKNPIIRQIILGFTFAIFTIGCMNVKIPVAEGVIVDQRNAIVIISGIFGGPIAAIISALLGGIYRAYLGGLGVLGGCVGLGLAAIAGIVLKKMRVKIDTVWKAAIGAMAATIFILPGFLPIVDLQTGWELLKKMALPYGSAIFLGVLLVGLLLNHEERRHIVKRELIKSEKRYRELFERLMDVIYRTDHKGNFVVISYASEKIFGYLPADLIGKQITNFYKIPSRREAFIKLLKENGHVENFEAEIRKKDGTFIWISTNAIILLDAQGKYIGVEGVTRDISKLKKAEEEKLQLEDKLRQSQKMESIGTLAGGIAHDFNNILTAIIGYAEIAMDDVHESGALIKDIQGILQAGMRAKDLVNHILVFSRKSSQDNIPVEINLILKEVLRLLRAIIPTTIDIKLEVKYEEGMILADPTEIHQVIMNLCTNAAYAMEKKGGVLNLVLERIVLTENDLQKEPNAKPGNYIVLKVIDKGCGINQEDIGRIFDPYFTTRKIGKGSGMGLAVVHGIVRRLNGIITVESKSGRGSTFNVFFPEINMKKSTAKETESLPKGNERILLVDDEPLVVDVTKIRLKKLGYEVTALTSSIAALESFRVQPEAFDLVITDQSMPKMSGVQLSKELLGIRSDISIILCTGYSSIVDAEKSKSIGIKGFIMKPVNQKELAVTIRNILDAGTTTG